LGSPFNSLAPKFSELSTLILKQFILTCFKQKKQRFCFDLHMIGSIDSGMGVLDATSKVSWLISPVAGTPLPSTNTDDTA
jgi:hypothetical protein